MLPWSEQYLDPHLKNGDNHTGPQFPKHKTLKTQCISVTHLKAKPHIN